MKEKYNQAFQKKKVMKEKKKKNKASEKWEVQMKTQDGSPRT